MFKLGSISIILVLAMTGCATQNEWSKPGWTQQEWANDRLECRAMAKRMGGDGYNEEDPNWEICMQSKGWVIINSKTVMRPLI